MELIVTESYDELSRRAAELFAGLVLELPEAAVVAATGNTPMGMYKELARLAERGELDCSRLRVFQLDAYLGVPPSDSRSLEGWTLRSFVLPLGARRDRFVPLRGDAPDPERECREYESAVRKAGGFDVAILGLGPNGHLGFNEPPSDPGARTRLVEIAEESLESNARYWGGRDRVPRWALTAGMDLLLSARRILLLVSGETKREVLRRTVEGPACPDVPSSYLATLPQATILADRAARG